MRARAAGSVRRKVRRLAWALAALACSAGAQVRVVATADSVWTLPAASAPGDVLDRLAAGSRLLARADSSRGDTLFVTPGPVAAVGRVEVVGLDALGALDWRTTPGARFWPDSLRRDLGETALRYAALGYGAASLVPDLQVTDGGRTVDVVVRVDQGPRSDVVAVELVGGRGPSRAFASRRAGLTGPIAPGDLDRQRVRRALLSSGLYTEVGDPSLAVDGDGLVLQVPVVEAPPGAFDVVLGYLPPAGGAGGGVVGRGRVDLRNVFGGGRTASAQLERTPGLASAFAVDVSDPFVFGTPFGVGASFAGEARDSTLSRQRFGADVRYPFDPTLEVSLSLARESVRPGTFGAREVAGAPRVRRSDELLAGAGLRLVRVDDARAPRRGVTLAVLVEQGRRAGAETSGRRRLAVRSRGYLPTLPRQAVVLGLDATVTQRELGAGLRADEGDLVRFGGAASFRGYDEASLLAASYARAVAEYRVLFDAALVRLRVRRRRGPGPAGARRPRSRAARAARLRRRAPGLDRHRAGDGDLRAEPGPGRRAREGPRGTGGGAVACVERPTTRHGDAPPVRAPIPPTPSSFSGRSDCPPLPGRAVEFSPSTLSTAVIPAHAGVQTVPRLSERLSTNPRVGCAFPSGSRG